MTSSSSVQQITRWPICARTAGSRINAEPHSSVGPPRRVGLTRARPAPEEHAWWWRRHITQRPALPVMHFRSDGSQNREYQRDTRQMRHAMKKSKPPLNKVQQPNRVARYIHQDCTGARCELTRASRFRRRLSHLRLCCTCFGLRCILMA